MLKLIEIIYTVGLLQIYVNVKNGLVFFFLHVILPNSS